MRRSFVELLEEKGMSVGMMKTPGVTGIFHYSRGELKIVKIHVHLDKTLKQIFAQNALAAEMSLVESYKNNPIQPIPKFMREVLLRHNVITEDVV